MTTEDWIISFWDKWIHADMYERVKLIEEWVMIPELMKIDNPKALAHMLSSYFQDLWEHAIYYAERGEKGAD